MPTIGKPKLLIFKIGHSKSDPGSIGDDTTTPEPGDIIQEYQLNFGIAMNIGALSVPVMVINDDENLDLPSAVKAINQIVADRGLTWRDVILVSIHSDWSGAPSGTFAYYLGSSGGVDEGKAAESKRLAGIMVGKASEKLKYPNRGIKPDTASRFGRLGIIRDTLPLAVLLECGSIGADLDLLKNRSSEIAEAIIEAIEDFTGEKISTLTVKDRLRGVVENMKKIWTLANANGNRDEVKRFANRSANLIRETQRAIGLEVSE